MENEDEGACNTGLCLGLGIGGCVPKKKKQKQIRENNNQVGPFDLPFELCPKGGGGEHHQTLNSTDHEDHHHHGGFFRKKLRLSKDQSSLLEESFKLHTTLNPAQKHSLAEKLNLRPRQVEVWFQNRRARTKLKQTEIDCEFLRKCCENLRDENRRLKKELQELRAHKIVVGTTTTTTATSPLFIQLSKTTAAAAMTTTCSSCQKPFKANDANNINNKSTSSSSKKHKLESVALDCYVG